MQLCTLCAGHPYLSLLELVVACGRLRLACETVTGCPHLQVKWVAAVEERNLKDHHEKRKALCLYVICPVSSIAQ